MRSAQGCGWVTMNEMGPNDASGTSFGPYVHDFFFSYVFFLLPTNIS